MRVDLSVMYNLFDLGNASNQFWTQDSLQRYFIVAIKSNSKDASMSSEYSICLLLFSSNNLLWLITHSNSNSTFIVLNLCQKADSKAHHTKTLVNIHKPEALQGSAPQRKQEIGNLGWICFSEEVWLQLWPEGGKWVCRADLVRKVIPNHRCVIRKTESKMLLRLENWSKVGNLKKHAIRLTSAISLGIRKGYDYVFGVTTM